MRVCTRCVMDTTDNEITFDEQGVCNHCHFFDSFSRYRWKKEGLDDLMELVDEIKNKEKNKLYDCIIGLSGGVDSSYLLYFAVKKLGLRVLAVHIDAGWNSLVAVSNIEKLVNGLGVDLHTIVIDWEEMKDVQVAFLKSGVANCDAPQDHAFFSALYDFAIKMKIKYILTGANIATESVLPISWGHFAMDGIHLRDIHKQFGDKKLKRFPVTGFFKYYFYYPYFANLKVLAPLNYINYQKKEAIKELVQEFGWENYGRKHSESIWTKFFQNYFLPVKFGFDKRKAHLSSLILSGEMFREEALNELQKSLYNEYELKQDISYIQNKLEFTPQEWENIMQVPIRSYREYKNNEKLYLFKKNYLDKILNKLFGKN